MPAASAVSSKTMGMRTSDVEACLALAACAEGWAVGADCGAGCCGRVGLVKMARTSARTSAPRNRPGEDRVLSKSWVGKSSGEDCKFAKLLQRFGGPGRDRTDDLFHAMEARSQLRHRPTDGTILLSWSETDSSTNGAPQPRLSLGTARAQPRMQMRAASNRRRFGGIVLQICPFFEFC